MSTEVRGLAFHRNKWNISEHPKAFDTVPCLWNGVRHRKQFDTICALFCFTYLHWSSLFCCKTRIFLTFESGPRIQIAPLTSAVLWREHGFRQPPSFCRGPGGATPAHSNFHVKCWATRASEGIILTHLKIIYTKTSEHTVNCLYVPSQLMQKR